MNGILLIKDKLDNLYNRITTGNEDLLNELDSILVDILKYDDLSIYDVDEAEQIISMINSFTEKINSMYELLDVQINNMYTLEYLREEFKKIEIKKFNIENSYVMGIITVNDLNAFKEMLFQFRNTLYAIPINDDNLLEIAKMKSKIQHFNTYVLEDEEILKQAYKNSN